MDIRNRQQLRARAEEALGAAPYSPGKLALMHTGAAVGLSLLITVINFFLSQQIDSTGGLSGMGLRTLLSTAQTVLPFISILLLPFWEPGFVFAAMKLSRRQEALPQDLLRGFHRFGPVLRLNLLLGGIYLCVITLSVNIASMLYMLSPFSAPLLELILSAEADPEAAQALLSQSVTLLLPLYGILLILLGVIAVPIIYRFRLAQYLIVDDPRIGALAALGTSHRMMRNNRMAMFRLDISFWWFYLLQMLSTVLGYSDYICSLLGFQLPVSETAAFFGSFAIHCAGQLLIAWFFASRVAVTYATAYDALREAYREAEPPLVKNFPWDFLPEQKED